MPAVIVENDESKWKDETGNLYHFPKRYLSLLTPGQQVVYYKGRLRDPAFASNRLSADRHYFGIAKIGRVYADPDSSKGDQFATIENYRAFADAVPAKRVDGSTYEVIPANRNLNYWRDGVREISKAIYDAIVGDAIWTKAVESSREDISSQPDFELESGLEGSPGMIFTTVYERDPALREQALAIHGYTCFGCGCNFEDRYGPHGREFIHVHHLKPLHSLLRPQLVNPQTDMVPVCPNCHCMIHRQKRHTLSLEELRRIVRNDRK